MSDNLDDVDLMDMSAFIEGRDAALFQRLREEDPLHWNAETGGPGFWSLTRYEDVKEGLIDHPRLSSAKGTQIGDKRVEGKLSSLHNMDPPRHSKLRRVAAPFFRMARVQQWRPVIDDSVEILLDQTIDKGPVDFVETIAAKLPVMVLGRVIGVPPEDGERMIGWTNKLIDPESRTSPEMIDQARRDFNAYFGDLIEQRRTDPKDDLISVLVTGSVDGEPLSADELEAYLSLFVAAGNETTRNLISGGLLALDEFPNEWDRLRAQPSMLASAVEEMLRWVTPLACQRRTATEDIEMYGKTIFAGDKVVLWFGSANRDPRRFKNPEQFVIDRFQAARDAQESTEHIAFGWGIHFCMGAHLARAEMMSLFGELLNRRIDIDVLGPPVRLESNMFHGIKELPVELRSSATAQ